MSLPRLAVAALALAAVSQSAIHAQVRWSQLNPGTSPSARNQVALVDVFLHNYVLLYGGEGVGRTALADTWIWNGTAWQQQSPTTSPTRRGGSAAAYDFVRDRVLLFSGWNGNQYEPESWDWDPVAQDWAQATPANQPSARDWARAVFYPAANNTVLFGGHVWTLSPTQLGDTWTWDGTNWTQQNPPVSPGARFGHAMVFDPNRGTVLLFGGAVAGVGASNDMWEWNGMTWTQITPATLPPARSFHSMTYDSLRGRVVMFGGNLGGSPTDEVWEWDGNDWTQRLPGSPSPSPRAFAEIAYFTMAQETLLFGGATAIPRGSPVFDTWNYGPVQPATSSTFGSGCAGSAGTPTLACSELAWLGDQYSISLASAPANGLAVFALGFSDTMTSAGVPLPFALTPFGIPCTLYVDPFALLFVPTSSAGSATNSFALPNNPAFLGQVVFAQSGAVDSGATGGITTSNACRHVLGGR